MSNSRVPTTITAVRFPNPFPGKPTPLNLSGLFLLDPSVIVKLEGRAMHSLLLDAGFGAALCKRLERATMDQVRASELLSAMVDILPVQGLLIMETWRAALNGNETAIATLNAMGPWETFYSGHTEPLGYCDKYRLAIERASREPLDALRRGQFNVAVKQLQHEPLTNALLWAEAVATLGGATAVQDLPWVQFAGALEFELSSLAAFDVQMQHERGSQSSLISMLLPTQATKLNPAALFFRWVMRSSGAKSMNDLVTTLELSGRPIHIVSLKNWHRGARMPSVSWLKLITSLKPELARNGEIDLLYWATKLLIFLGYYGTRVAELSQTEIQQAPNREKAAMRVRPWPTFPLGYADFGEWTRARYPTWITYHRARMATSPA